jgi:hypothetical protein
MSGGGRDGGRDRLPLVAVVVLIGVMLVLAVAVLAVDWTSSSLGAKPPPESTVN